METLRLKKWEGNPILKPAGKGNWEKVQVCNPGAWYEGGKIYLLYRASGEFEDYRIYTGLATSEDGFHFRRVSDKPVLSPAEKGFDAGCVEDPRIVKFGDTFYVTYACRAHPPGAFWRGDKPEYPAGSARTWTENLSRTGLASSRDLRTFRRLGPITRDDVDDRDAIIFPEKVKSKYVMFHRPAEWVGPKYGCEKASMWLAYSDDLLHWGEDCLLATPKFDWESAKIGGSSPPIKTEEGWLVIYHGVDKNTVYRTGVMMLDSEDPRRVTHRSPYFIMEPEAPFEKEGFVPNVVFPCGNVVIDGTLFVYYGGADMVCCAATIPLKTLVEYVMRFPEKA